MLNRFLTMKQKVPSVLYRCAEFDRASLNEEDRTIELSISSDAPYERYFGVEILDHRSECVDMERMTTGAPLLFNHDRDAHLGRIISARLDGQKLIVKAKFGNSELAKEKLADVRDGILKESSVGYRVLAMALEKKEEDLCTYRVTKWMPYEGSLVTIPADVSVGVGRSDSENDIEIDVDIPQQKLDTDSQHKKMADPITPPVAAPAKIEITSAQREEIKQEALTADRKRQSEIRDIEKVVRERQKVDCREAADKFISEGKSADEFRHHVLVTEFKAVPVQPNDGKTGANKREIESFSVLKAIRDMASKGRLEGLERELCDTAQKSLHRELSDGQAFVIPAEVEERDAMRSLSMRAQSAGVFTAGGATVANELGALIEYLRNQTVLGRLGITMIPGLVGDVLFPVQTGGCSAYWLSETGAITDSEATFAQKAMTPHRLGASVPFTTQFIAQTSIGAEAFLRNELNTVLGLKKDLAGLEGSGNAGEPLGVKNTTGINATVTFGGAATWADVVEFETGIAADNADIGSMKFALSAAAVGKWKTILKDSVAGAGYLISDSMTANGYKVERTNQISGSIAFFGVWSQLLHGMWAGREVIVDPYTLKKSGQVEITMNELCDFLVRQPLAFNVSTDSAAQ